MAADTTRNYDSSRRQSQGRVRILDAALGLARDRGGWSWDQITFKAVAAAAEVSERTVYRHFPTQRDLHEAILLRINEDAEISYVGLAPEAVPDVVDRLFRSLETFTPDLLARTHPSDAAIAMNKERMEALTRAYQGDARLAALVDVLWSTDAYERLVLSWRMTTEEAVDAVTWALTALTALVDHSRAGAPNPD